MIADIKARLINAGINLVLEPAEAYVMHQNGMDKMMQNYGTSGWVYIDNPNLVFSLNNIDTYLLQVHIYASTVTAVDSILTMIRKSMSNAQPRGMSPYKFTGYQFDGSKIGSIHGIISFEATQFFNPL